ncbi:MAG TPA: DUF2726 domain-containing protein [Phycisphaerales bacterium]|nr:DUF2726 domain-containing protein [Phycisphaerales bacterium]
MTTPDGQMRLTEPPFLGRGRLLSPSRAAFAERLRRRLPAGLVLCPMVRLEALVEPTAPQGYDPADWRRWRRRVRLRAVHLLLCEAPTWRPVLAILLEAPGCAARAERRPDAITDEVLRHIGLPVVRCDPADRAAFDEHARRIVGLAVSAAA